MAERATPLPDLLVPLDLDPLTVPDDNRFVDTLGQGGATCPQEVAAHVTESLLLSQEARLRARRKRKSSRHDLRATRLADDT